MSEIIKGYGGGSQGSSKVQIFSPVPTAQLRPFSTIFRPSSMLLHPQEGKTPISAVIALPLLKYLPLKILDNKEVGCVTSRQNCLPKSARFWILRSLNP